MGTPQESSNNPGPSNDPSVFAEPHLRGMLGGEPTSQSSLPVADPCWKCGYDRRGVRRDAMGRFVCPECGATEFDGGASVGTSKLDDDDAVDHSVFDEPSVPLSDVDRAAVGEKTHAPDGSRLTYAGWLTERVRTFPSADAWGRVMCIALAAGPWAILGAFSGELGSGMGDAAMFGAVLVAPVVEEVMKLAAATWAVERRPYWFKTPGQLLLACAAGGVAFAAIENVIYLKVYIPSPSAELSLWRWTVCVALHTVCSMIAGFGLVRVWRRTMSTLTRPELGLGVPLLIAAMVVHGLYNAFAVWLELIGGAF